MSRDQSRLSRARHGSINPLRNIASHLIFQKRSPSRSSSPDGLRNSQSVPNLSPLSSPATTASSTTCAAATATATATATTPTTINATKPSSQVTHRLSTVNFSKITGRGRSTKDKRTPDSLLKNPVYSSSHDHSPDVLTDLQSDDNESTNLDLDNEDASSTSSLEYMAWGDSEDDLAGSSSDEEPSNIPHADDPLTAPVTFKSARLNPSENQSHQQSSSLLKDYSWSNCNSRQKKLEKVCSGATDDEDLDPMTAPEKINTTSGSKVSQSSPEIKDPASPKSVQTNQILPASVPSSPKALASSPPMADSPGFTMRKESKASNLSHNSQLTQKSKLLLNEALFGDSRSLSSVNQSRRGSSANISTNTDTQSSQAIWEKFLKYTQSSRSTDALLYALTRKEAWMQYNGPHAIGRYPEDTDIFELWLVHALKYLYHGNVLFSPSAREIVNINESCTILEIQGVMKDFWAWQLAVDNPHSTIYGFKLESENIGKDMNYEGPSNYLPFVGHSVLSLPFEDNFFDVISAKGLWYMLRSNEWDPALQELFRVLKPGGVIEIPVIDFNLLNNRHGAEFWSKARKSIADLDIDTGSVQRLPKRLTESGFVDSYRALLALPKGWGGQLGHLTDFVYSYLFESGLSTFADGAADPRQSDIRQLRTSIVSTADHGDHESFGHPAGLLCLFYASKPADSQDRRDTVTPSSPQFSSLPEVMISPRKDSLESRREIYVDDNRRDTLTSTAPIPEHPDEHKFGASLISNIILGRKSPVVTVTVPDEIDEEQR